MLDGAEGLRGGSRSRFEPQFDIFEVFTVSTSKTSRRSNSHSQKKCMLSKYLELRNSDLYFTCQTVKSKAVMSSHDLWLLKKKKKRSLGMISNKLWQKFLTDEMRVIRYNRYRIYFISTVSHVSNLFSKITTVFQKQSIRSLAISVDLIDASFYRKNSLDIQYILHTTTELI